MNEGNRKANRYIAKRKLAKGLDTFEFKKDIQTMRNLPGAFDLDRKQYWRMENGANITIKTLIKILSIHEISLEEFFKDLK